MDLKILFEKAMKSKSGLAKLNFILLRGIPFNKPHKLKIVDLNPGKARVFVPYIRRNKNHINGIHACCLATACEYSTGLVLLSTLDASKFRLIMKKIDVDYHYQAKMNAYAEYTLSEQELQESIISEAEKNGVVDYTCEVKLLDVEQNHICTGRIEWQIKNWNKVKTATSA